MYKSVDVRTFTDCATIMTINSRTALQIPKEFTHLLAATHYSSSQLLATTYLPYVPENWLFGGYLAQIEFYTV